MSLTLGVLRTLKHMGVVFHLALVIMTRHMLVRKPGAASRTLSLEGTPPSRQASRLKAAQLR